MRSFQPIRVTGYHQNGRTCDLGSFTGVTLRGDQIAVWPGNRDLLRRDTTGAWRRLDQHGRPQQKFTEVEFTTFTGG